MQDSLIEQVKQLAEAQKCGALFEKLTRIETGVYVPTWFYFDFPALRAELERKDAALKLATEVCASATAINEGYKNRVYVVAANELEDCKRLARELFTGLDRDLAAYRAALERMKP